MLLEKETITFIALIIDQLPWPIPYIIFWFTLYESLGDKLKEATTIKDSLKDEVNVVAGRIH